MSRGTSQGGLVRLGVSCLALLLAGTASAGFVTIGTPDGGNYFPLGSTAGNLNAYSGEYQQIYTSSAFAGPVTISSVAFASLSNGGAAPVQFTDTFTVGLSTSPATLSTLSSNYAANEGADFTTVFSGSLTAVDNGTGAFDAVIPTSAFTYDPSKGDLLLDIVVTSSTGESIAFEATSDPVTSRVFNLNGSGAASVNADYGLVTQFGVSPAGATVPEPGSLVLMSLGCAGLLAVARGSRRRPGRQSGLAG